MRPSDESQILNPPSYRDYSREEMSGVTERRGEDVAVGSKAKVRQRADSSNVHFRTTALIDARLALL